MCVNLCDGLNRASLSHWTYTGCNYELESSSLFARSNLKGLRKEAFQIGSGMGQMPC
jgi:hypothetical protein